MKKLLSILLVATMICTALPAMVFADTSADAGIVTEYTVYSSGKATLEKPDTTKKIKWSTSKKTVATVSNKGVVTALKAGTCKITAKFGKEKQIYNITVPSTYENFADVPDFGALYSKKNTLGKLSEAKMKKIMVKFFPEKQYADIFLSMVDIQKINYAGYTAKNKSEAAKLVKKYKKNIESAGYEKVEKYDLWSNGNSAMFLNNTKKEITIGFMNRSDLKPIEGFITLK